MNGPPPKPVRDALTDDAFLSVWGKRIRALQSWNWSLAGIGRAIGTSRWNVWQLLNNPRAEPLYGLGMRLKRLYVRELLKARRERGPQSDRDKLVRDPPRRVERT